MSQTGKSCGDFKKSQNARRLRGRDSSRLVSDVRDGVDGVLRRGGEREMADTLVRLTDRRYRLSTRAAFGTDRSLGGGRDLLDSYFPRNRSRCSGLCHGNDVGERNVL